MKFATLPRIGLRPEAAPGESRAFTLIELLAVIAVVSILSSLVLSSLTSAKHQVRGTACISNGRQIWLAYALARGDDPADSSLGKTSIADFLITEVGLPGNRIWLCPEINTNLDGQASQNSALTLQGGTINSPWVDVAWQAYLQNSLTSMGTVSTTQPLRVCSYTCNAWMLGQLPDYSVEPELTGFFYQLESDVENPSLTPLLGDGVEPWALPGEHGRPPASLITGIDPNAPPSPNLADTIQFYGIARHGSTPPNLPVFWPSGTKMPGAINISFADGSSRAVPLETLWSLNWHKEWAVPSHRPGLQ